MPDTVTVFAPATIANLGPGFDVLGVAVEGMGDRVTATRCTTPGITIESIEGDGGRLPLDAEVNTAGVAAREVLALLGAPGGGVRLRIRKGLPLGSGLGSSAASAAAAAWAVNLLWDAPLRKEQLLHACLVAEAAVSGWHADNVAPALLGGWVLVRAYDPLDIIALPAPNDLFFVLATPAWELPTREARAVVPQQVTLAQHVANSGNLAAMVAALFGGSPALLGRAMQDAIVEPARAALIPAFAEAKQAALDAGALACSISGAGPTLFALTTNADDASMIAGAVTHCWEQQASLRATIHIARVDGVGARAV